ncbi:MAG: UDP-N-acetylmuramate--L-alanine ligase [Actinomycetes bacterium]
MNGIATDLTTRRRIHVVGVGGPGMSAIATTLQQMGHEVSGSDIKDSPVIDRLRGLGVLINIGHDEDVVHDCDYVTASTAIPQNNIEIVAARLAGITVLNRAQILAAICFQRPTIGVAGTHGKTTTTSLLVRIFTHAGLNPNFIVGGDVLNESTGARWTNSQWTIVEADESDGTHLELPLTASILTNIDSDHLDHYNDLAGITESFARYLSQIQGPRVVCCDDPLIRNLSHVGDWCTYGFDSTADFCCHDVTATDGRTEFAITDQRGDGLSVTISMSLRGMHNVLNVTGAVAMAVACGIEMQVAADAIRTFDGVGRRFQIVGDFKGATLVDDYAHLPREIEAVLAAAKFSDDGWGRIVAVFQPNRFNRMAIMSPEYGDAFANADLVVITDIYSSGTEKIEGVTGELVAHAVRARRPAQQVLYFPSRDSLAEQVSALLQPGDVCISMGCGDIEFLPHEILETLRRRGH